jgi:hypothetical protein
LTALFFGILIATKVSSLVLLPLPLLALLIRHMPTHRWGTTLKAWMLMHGFIHATKNLLIFTIIALSVYMFSNPYVQLDKKSYTDSIKYESEVALGTLPVFYTGEFFDTTPIVFQIHTVYPFLLNPLIFLLALPSFVYIAYSAKKSKRIPSFFLVLFFVVILVSQAALFVKWTRYMVPTLPFLYLIIASALTTFITVHQINKNVIKFTTSVGACICIIFALSYFITVYIKPDTRITAATFAEKTVPKDAYILSEMYDMGIVPFNNLFPMIKLFNFYDLDGGSIEFNELTLNDELAKAEYIILPSQRVIKSRLMQKERFPKGNQFYTQLFNESLGFQKIYETPCDIFCQITYLGNPSMRYEQTANVFDRPTVYIFKRM